MQLILPSSNKNLLIYDGNIEEAYQKITRLYNLQGNSIFNSNEYFTNYINDPFQPDGLNIHASSNYDAPSKLSAKTRKRNQLQPLNMISLSNNTTSIPSNTI
ncbi:hypothetical protein RclHR1_07680020 [Rhizophagus clarus]|uniref:Uncharacterized protein n=1 Tax=Rhizophagus clarus TaxID=94130 RepID=A0A2Z6RXP4_9GLOM|nr:hypothetical protein RclHR1_07680020 [Rhizophagus clarus]